MEEKLEKVKEILVKENQEQLLKYPMIQEKEELLDSILDINFEQLNGLYQKAIEKEEKTDTAIKPISYIEKASLPKQEKEMYTQLGEKIIREGKYAVITMAGGQGTRLGHNGPKGTYDFGLENHKTIFEILCDNLKEAHQKYQLYIPWYIMTSKQNHEETIQFFKEKKYFDYPKEKIYFFKQGELPVLNEQGKLLLDKEGNINEAADGHGGIFVSMRKNGVIENMKQTGN